VFIHLQEGICGNTNKRAKNVQENKAQIPFYTIPKERGPQPGKIGPKREENKDKLKSNHLIFAEHQHRPTQEVQRSRPTEDGLIWAHSWCGCIATRPKSPHFWQATSYRLPMVGSGGDGGNINA